MQAPCGAVMNVDSDNKTESNSVYGQKVVKISRRRP